MAKRIWLIGGTQESAQIARAIALTSLSCIISVTTEAARSLYPAAPNLQIWVGKLVPQQVKTFLQDYSVALILDASHPYALGISQLAIAAAADCQISYLRFERPALETEETVFSSLITRLDSFNSLLVGNYLDHQRVLLTIGYRFLPLFQPWQDKVTLFARILPSPIALETALAAGFTSDRLIALRPPVSFELENALWQQWQISLVVTKASGTPGGEDIKRQVAQALRVRLAVITRPPINYPQQTSSLETALEFCHQMTKDSDQKSLRTPESIL